ncbi:hypothetical protein ACRCD5_03540 [Campylobacter taeniopygiae]|uniref:hypothetical protein n=1 Tax=Campylobacter taeniopygiae TaxID=2510188 RepID=UPI003D6AF310
MIREAMKNGEIKTVAIRPEEFLSITKSPKQVCCEERDWGKEFYIDLLKEGKERLFVSKFYDNECYGDSLWIKINTKETEITFEEILEEQEFTELKVAQVVHIKYFLENNNYYINHIDHEYISYTPEEYEERKNNHAIKGKKIKTIKIDNSKIPFVKENIVQPFLIKFLANFFTKNKLIMEYFKKSTIEK